MRYLALLLVLLIAPAAGATEPLKIVYPNLSGHGTSQLGYQALDLAMRKSGVPYSLEMTPEPVSAPRARAMLDSGEVSALDLGASQQTWAQYLAVPFPIDRGLLGWRVFLIRKDHESDFARIKSLEDLKKLTVGQGSTWPENRILTNAGLHVETNINTKSLVAMLEGQRFDFVSLGINEIYGVLDAHKDVAPDVTVEKHIVVTYPYGRFFYVKQGNEALRDTILHGLQVAFEDGSYQALFDNHPTIREGLSQADISNRVQIRLENPSLPEAFWKVPRKYFLDPGAGK